MHFGYEITRSTKGKQLVLTFKVFTKNNFPWTSLKNFVNTAQFYFIP